MENVKGLFFCLITALLAMSSTVSAESVESDLFVSWGGGSVFSSGDNVSLQVVVNNTGNESAYNVSVVLFGVVSDSFVVPVVGAGEVVVVNFTVPAVTGTVYVNVSSDNLNATSGNNTSGYLLSASIVLGASSGGGGGGGGGGPLPIVLEWDADPFTVLDSETFLLKLRVSNMGSENLTSTLVNLTVRNPGYGVEISNLSYVGNLSPGGEIIVEFIFPLYAINDIFAESVSRATAVVTATNGTANYTFQIESRIQPSDVLVGGKVRAKGFMAYVEQIVDNVFDEGYELLSLGELESYVSQEKHLPGVSSKTEMQENGINLVETILNILKKVEENTLYLTGHDEQITNLENNVTQLQNESDVMASVVGSIGVQITNLSNNYNALDFQYDVLSGNYSSLNAQYGVVSSDVVDLETSFVQLQNESDVMASVVGSMEVQIQNLTDDYDVLDFQYGVLSSNYNNLSTQYNTLSTQYGALQVENELLEGQLSSLNARMGNIPINSGLSLWLDASKITGVADRGKVSRWTDFSEEGYDVIQTSEDKQPQYVANGVDGLPVVRFDGIDDYMDTDFVGPGGEEVTVFVVGKSNVDSGMRSVVRFQDEDGGFMIYPWVSGGKYRPAVSSQTDVWDNNLALDAGFTTGNWSVGSFTWKSGEENGYKTYMNGILMDQKNASNTTLPMERLSIGAYVGSWTGEHTDADIAEILVYNKALTSEEQGQIENYLSQKYGLD